MSDADAEIRAISAQIADGYNRVPFKPKGKGSPGLDPYLLFGIAGAYGDFALRGDIDVLDLGCGSGGQLLRVGGLTKGRLVGIDISRVACNDAKRQCAAFGARCTIHCSDLFDLDPASLGQFDLIYLLGVYLVVPPAVQQRLIEVLTACLKPGGVAVISYYAGDVWRQMDLMRKAVHAAVDRRAPSSDQLKTARRCVQDMAQNAGKSAVLTRLLEHSLKGDDATFFHEMMGPVLAEVKATELEAALSPAGIHFLNWLEPGPFSSITDPAGRAAAADRISQGGYRYGVFGRYDPAKPADWGHLSWITGLRRAGVSGYGIPIFHDTATGGRIEVANSTTAAALDMLARGPVQWNVILQAIMAHPAGATYLPSVKRDFLSFWASGVLTPIAQAV